MSIGHVHLSCRLAILREQKHGLAATQVVVPGEDPATYDSFREWLMNEIRPQSVVEEEMADRLASAFWRLRRIPLPENALFAWLQNKQWRKDTDILEDADLRTLRPGWTTARQAEDDAHTAQSWPGREPAECQTLRLLGRTIEDALSDQTVLTKLSGYEARLMRQAERLMAQLRRSRLWGATRRDDLMLRKGANIRLNATWQTGPL